jgi:hypothetical protein
LDHGASTDILFDNKHVLINLNDKMFLVPLLHKYKMDEIIYDIPNLVNEYVDVLCKITHICNYHLTFIRVILELEFTINNDEMNRLKLWLTQYKTNQYGQTISSELDKMCLMLDMSQSLTKAAR